MKKLYEGMNLEVIFFLNDVITGSNDDNVTDMPDFPEYFQ